MRKGLRSSSLTVSAIAISTAVLITGCTAVTQQLATAAQDITQEAVPASPLAGNWSFALVSITKPGQLAAITGSLHAAAPGTEADTTSSLTGVIHIVPAQGQSAAALCYAQNQPIAISGSIAAGNAVTLASAAFHGNVLTIAGTWDAATRTLTHATLAVAASGSGSCGSPAQPMIGAQYAPIHGTYIGTFNSTQDGPIPVTATLTQTSQPDASGTFHLQGSATFPSDSCITSPVVTDSTVTGSAFSATYTDATSGAVVTASGSFNQDATTLTITSYTLTGTGGCSDTGTGTLSN